MAVWARMAQQNSGATAISARRRCGKADLWRLQQLQVVGFRTGDALQQDTAELLAGRRQVFVDRLDFRLDLAEQPRGLLGDDIVVLARASARDRSSR